MKYAPTSKGFTLIELSIVLVIISLIAGGVLVGKDLIQASKIRQTVSQTQEYTTAINTFRLKYNCLAGDCANAYDFFGATCGGDSDNVSGCNGNGDKSWYSGHYGDAYDGRKAWQHLSLAGMIAGDWPGGSAGGITYPGVNIPQTPLGDFTMWTFTTMDATQNTLRLSSPRPPPQSPHQYGQWRAISGPTAYALDAKIDDGQAASGKVIGRNGLSTACLSAGNYNMNDDDIRCLMYFNNF